MRRTTKTTGEILTGLAAVVIAAIIGYVIWGWIISHNFPQLTFAQGGVIGLVIMSLTSSIRAAGRDS